MIRLALALALGLLLGACFTAPGGAVQFSCDEEKAPTCPPGYSCQEDGCCHRNGSDVEQNLGACRGLDSGTGAGTAGSGIPTGGPGSGSTSGSDTGTTEPTDSSTGTQSGTDTGTAGTAT